MKILLAIHFSNINSEDFQRFLEIHLKQDPNTYLLVFPSYPKAKEALERLKQKFAKFKENFIYIEPRSFLEKSRFSPYKKRFREAIKSLQKRCGKNESIQVISFGGSARICYDAINYPAHKAVQKLLGNGRKIEAYTYLPFVYGKVGQRPKIQPKKPIPKKIFNIFSFIRRRKK